MPKRASAVALDLFANDPELLSLIQSAAKEVPQEFPKRPWMGLVFGTGMSENLDHHLLLGGDPICGATVYAVVQERGVIAANIDCPLCKPVVQAWPPP